MSYVRVRRPRLHPRWFVRLAWYTHRALYRLTGGRVGLWRARSNRWGTLRLTTGRRTHQANPRNDFVVKWSLLSNPLHRAQQLPALLAANLLPGSEKQKTAGWTIDQVDLSAALLQLQERYGVHSIRTDCVGRLNGALLEARLVDEVAVIVNPSLSGDPGSQCFVRLSHVGSRAGLALTLHEVEQLNNGAVWLRYDVGR